MAVPRAEVAAVVALRCCGQPSPPRHLRPKGLRDPPWDPLELRYLPSASPTGRHLVFYEIAQETLPTGLCLSAL